MYLFIDENPNCSTEERVFSTSGAKRTVSQLHICPPQQNEARWCDVVGVNEDGSFEPANALCIEDSADGTAWLVSGGSWGLRFKLNEHTTNWSLSDKTQWGLPFIVLDSSGSSIKFQ
jgi:hypothetical protein